MLHSFSSRLRMLIFHQAVIVPIVHQHADKSLGLASRGPPFGVDEISSGRSSRELERFSHHFIAFLPECLGVFRVERITAHTFADRGDSHIIWNYFAYMAVLAILSAVESRCNDRGPY